MTDLPGWPKPKSPPRIDPAPTVAALLAAVGAKGCLNPCHVNIFYFDHDHNIATRPGKRVDCKPNVPKTWWRGIIHRRHNK